MPPRRIMRELPQIHIFGEESFIRAHDTTGASLPEADQVLFGAWSARRADSAAR